MGSTFNDELTQNSALFTREVVYLGNTLVKIKVCHLENKNYEYRSVHQTIRSFPFSRNSTVGRLPIDDPAAPPPTTPTRTHFNFMFLTGQGVCVCVAAAAQQVAMGYSNSTLIRQPQLHLLQQQQHLQEHNAEAVQQLDQQQ
ncbi:hypothetical protein PsorP6_008698 [Peronosclerospora sorghi]|uniref:Uncharacterized protein n=1 Tax=Peronosclerospora sorghi TaxID=230839 RepID=A0ACC0W1D0_9STRA|nr:hypothetical protein PsorP6_008698 [Peronosclerospora sorghi]